MDGSAAGQQVEDNWKIMTSVYIVFIQIQEHCHNVVTTVSDVRRNDLGAGKSCLLSECCPHIWPGAGAGRRVGEEERASCRGNQAAGGAAAGMTSVTLHITAAVRATGPLRPHLKLASEH